MGFSAGGYVAGASAILLRDEVPVWKDYTPEDIDRESGLSEKMNGRNRLIAEKGKVSFENGNCS